MPLPTPNKDEKQEDFISRCIKFVMDEGTTDDNKQAAAICYSQWRKHNKNVVRTVYRRMSASIINNPSMENKSKSKVNRSRQDAYTAVAMVGDQFWNKGRTKEFCLFDGIRNGYKTMDKTFHNLDHGNDPHGSGHIRIQDIVGIQDYTEIDENSKQMIMYIFPDEHMPSYGTWKAFIDMCQKNGKTPNVSIEAMITQEQMNAKDIPVENLDYKSLDIDDDDLIWVETGYRFLGAATVYMGACNDEDGCGILPNSEKTVDVGNCDTVVSKNDELVTDICDCNNSKMTVMVNDTSNCDEGEKKIMSEKEVKVEKEEIKDETVKLEMVKEVESLKSKLISCGELREKITNENTELTKRIAVLEAENKELKEKLSKPITTIETSEKEETVSDRGIKFLKSIMKK